MKSLLLMFLLPAMAQANEVATSTNTITQTISVSSYTPTDVAAATSSGTLGGYYKIEVFSIAGSSTLNCGFDVMLSTLSASAWYGREIAAGTGFVFNVPSYRKLYCMTQNVSATTRAIITQYK